MDMNLSQIVRLIDRDEYPEHLRNAIAFETATVDLADGVKHTAPVERASAITPDAVSTVHARAVEREVGREVAVKLADEMVKIANERVTAAWMSTVEQLLPTFAQQFDTAANTVATEVARIGSIEGADKLAKEHWNDAAAVLRTALDDLDRLATIRDAVAFLHGTAGPTEVMGDTYERSSRLAWFASTKVEQAWRQESSRLAPCSRWLVATTIPDMRLAWQTHAEQVAQPAPLAVAAFHKSALAGRR